MNFGKLFGKKEESEKGNFGSGVNNPKVTLDNLESQIQIIEGKIAHIDKLSKGFEAEAKAKLKAGDKTGAKRALLKKKKHLEQIKQLEGGLQMLEDQKSMLESMDSQAEMIKILKQGAAALKEQSKAIDINTMEDLKNDMDDIKDQQVEMNDFFASYNEEQNEGIEDELKALEAQMAKEGEDKYDLPNPVHEEIRQVDEFNKIKNILEA